MYKSILVRNFMALGAFGMLLMASDGVSAGPAWYGALAYCKDSGAWGWQTADDPDDAAEIALDRCREVGVNCRLELSFQNSCGAFAAGKRNVYGWAYASTVEEAKEMAMDECEERGSGCKIKISACTQRD